MITTPPEPTRPVDGTFQPSLQAGVHPKPAALEFLARSHRLLIDGEWVAAASGWKFDTFNPATGGVLAGVEVLDTFVNRDLTAVAVEFLCHIRQPACTLRIIDRFKVDAAGRITEQENFFDPRAVTNPG